MNQLQRSNKSKISLHRQVFRYLSFFSFLGTSVLLSYSSASAQVTNPNYVRGCNADTKIALLVDASSSISSATGGPNLEQDVKDGLTALFDSLEQSSSASSNTLQVGILDFGTGTELRVPYTDISQYQSSGNSSFNNYINSYPNRGPNPDTNNVDDVIVESLSTFAYTNWEEAFRESSSSLANADIVMIITDGNPTASLIDSANTQRIINSPSGTDPNEIAQALAQALPASESLQGAGSKIYAVGLGTNVAEANLQAISGDDRFSIASGNASEADYLLSSDINDFVSQLRGLTENICSISDYGDAPVSYDDTADNDVIDDNDNPARHGFDANLSLGITEPDVETAPQSSANANGDDNDSGGDDEDGISTFPELNSGQDSYSLTATVDNTTGSAANVYAWIDFDLDGEFDEDERATVVSTTSSGDVTLNWNNIGSTNGANITAGNSYLRIRTTTENLDSNADTGRDDASVGAASNGEVEDYEIAIANPVTSACPNAIADLWFANDESGSVTTAEFEDALDFLYQISDEFVYDDVTGVKAGVTGWQTALTRLR